MPGLEGSVSISSSTEWRGYSPAMELWCLGKWLFVSCVSQNWFSPSALFQHKVPAEVTGKGLRTESYFLVFPPRFYLGIYLVCGW